MSGPVLTSLQNPLVKLAASLHQKKYRDETGLFLVEGEEMIAMALQHGWQTAHVFTTTKQHKDDLLVSRDVLTKITKKENPQARVAVFKQRHATAMPSQIPTILLGVEEIRDPGNLGTLMRSCHAIGAKALLLIGPCCDPYGVETIRASMGSFAAVQIIQTTAEALIAWKETHPTAQLIGTDVIDAIDYREAPLTGACILLGNEQRGLSPRLKALCTSAVHIPMPGGTESLNVAMAGTLLLYEALRRPN